MDGCQMLLKPKDLISFNSGYFRSEKDKFRQKSFENREPQYIIVIYRILREQENHVCQSYAGIGATIIDGTTSLETAAGQSIQLQGFISTIVRSAASHPPHGH